jgi:hypothetical protein
MSLENGKQVVDSGEARLIALGEFLALICTDVYACTTVLLALLKSDYQDSGFLFRGPCIICACRLQARAEARLQSLHQWCELAKLCVMKSSLILGCWQS